MGELVEGQLVENRYEVLRPLGSGGIGEVYCVRDIGTGQKAALKLLNQSAGGQDVRKRFMREFHILSRMRHPHVVRTHSCGMYEGRPFFVMDYLQGKTLGAAITNEADRKVLVEQSLFSFLHQTLDGLAYIHEQGAIHRDLKPSNLMLCDTRSGRPDVRILDLGLARLREANAPSLTEAGLAMGTVEYMSPEQGKGAWVDQRSDLYSLGIVLYELLTGSPPFTGESPVSVIFKHIREVPPPPCLLNLKVDSEVQQIVMKLLEKEPIDRFQSASELLVVLKKVERKDDQSVEVRSESPKKTIVKDRVLRPHFLGREQEVKTLRRLLTAVEGGRRHTVVISGEAGIGKSRLIEELQGDAKVHGLRVLKGWCYEEGGRGCEPVLEALRSAGEIEFDQPRDSAWGHEVDPYAVAEDLADRLKGLCVNQPIAFCIEDIQWADELTLRFLQLCHRDPNDVPLMLCLTWRTGEEGSDFGRFERLFGEGETSRLTSLDLGRLTQRETAHLCASMLGERDIPQDAAQAVHDETGGHPLFVVELLQALIEAEILQQDFAGKWKWHPIPETLMPQGVMETLQRRISHVVGKQRRVLEYASVLRGTFRFDLLAAMWRGDELELLDTLEDLVRASLLQQVSELGEEYRFSHVLFQKAVYGMLPEHKRALLHRESGKALEGFAEGTRCESIEDLAYHFSRSGDQEKAFVYLWKAGRQAMSISAVGKATELFRQAAELKVGVFSDKVPLSETPEHEAGFFVDYAKALTLVGKYDESRSAINKALAALPDDLPELKARALETLGNVLQRIGDYSNAKGYMLESLRIFRKLNDTKKEIELLSALASHHENMGQINDAVQFILMAAERCGKEDFELRARAAYYLGYAALLENKYGKARSFFESALHVIEKAGRGNSRYQYFFLLGTCAFYTGDFDQVEMIYQDLKELFHRRGIINLEAVSLLKLGEATLELGDFVNSILYAQEAEALLVNLKEDSQLHKVHTLLAEAAARTGDLKQALEWMEKAVPGREIAGVTSTITWRRTGIVLAAAGRLEEAEEAFEQALHSKKVRHGFERTRSLIAAGEFHLERENFKKARGLLEDAKKIFEEMGSPYYAKKAARLLQAVTEKEKVGPVEEEEAVASAFVDKRLQALMKVCGDLTANLDLNVLLDQVLERLLTVVQADRALVALKGESPDGFIVEVARSHNLEQEVEAAISRSVIRDTMANDQPVFSLDARADTQLSAYQSVVDYDIRSVICVPLRHVSEEVIGALYADRRGVGDAFSEGDLDFLSAFAGLVAIAVMNARLHTRLQERALYLQQQVEERYQFGDLVGKDPAMQAVYRVIEQAAGTDVTVLLRGETGTGKELAARAVHYNSHRKEHLFMSQNCGALSPELLQSELFGHRKGAFTGASADREGLFAAADGGTVFLDEIGDASPEVQINLLRVLQEGEIRRVGDSMARKVDVRVVAATNRDLEEDVKAGRFREDLYYRLRVLQIEMPPLRERAGDIPLIAGHLLTRVVEEERRKVSGFTMGAVQTMVGFNWPGNVRQLENEIRRAVTLAEAGKEIGPELFSDEVRPVKNGNGALSNQDLKSCVEAFEKQRILEGLERCGGSIAKAAALLGVTRSGLYKKMARYGIERDQSGM